MKKLQHFIFEIHPLKMSTARKYTYAEVKEHNTPTDLWVVIHDKVYDVTKFLHEVYENIEILCFINNVDKDQIL